jgi:hypothetical protein
MHQDVSRRGADRRPSAPAASDWLGDELGDPLQAHGDITDSAETRRAAAEGVKGPGTSLPFQSRIQQSFGKFDISGTRAHVGSDAPDQIGADAYATGSDVVFNQAPDLHLAAHEAAHVVQQQGGVQLSGGVGAEGDAYEQHADAVADQVVAGESAEGLLASVAPSPGSRTTAVQMGKKDKQKKPAPKKVEQVDDEEDVSSDESDSSGPPDASVSLMEKVTGLGAAAGKTLAELKALLTSYEQVQSDVEEFDDSELDAPTHAAWEISQAMGKKFATFAGAIESKVSSVKETLESKLESLKDAPLYEKLCPKKVKDAASDLSDKIDAIEPTKKLDELEGSLDAAIDGEAALKALRTAKSNASVAWPSDAGGLTAMLGKGGTAVADGPTTPGRNKVTWTVNGVGFVCESHPYDDKAPIYHKGLHFHTSTEGDEHSKGRVPGDLMLTSLYMGSLD